MIEEELEKAVIEYLNTQTLPKIDSLVYRVIKNLIFGFSEPREKQIEELSKHIVELQNDKGELIDRCRELEAQIEKMKRCFNCKYHNKFVESKCGECEDYSKWEIKEK